MASMASMVQLKVHMRVSSTGSGVMAAAKGFDPVFP